MLRVLTLVIFMGLGLSATAQQQPDPFADLIPESEAKSLPIAKKLSGPYQIVPQANTGNVWVLDTKSGALRLCSPPPKKGRGTPECYPWGDATK